MKMTVTESSEFQEVEDGAYDAIIDKAEEVEGLYGMQFKFWFKLPAVGISVTAFCSQSLGTKSKLYGWVTAILGEVQIGQDLDIPEDLIGKSCRVLVSNEANKKGDLWPRITKVGPAKAKPTAKVPATVDF